MAGYNRFYSSTKFKSRSEVVNAGLRCFFISHQKKDKEDARKVADYLEEAGLDVYFDEYDRDLRIQHQNNNPTEVTKSICTGINNSSDMIVVVSPNTLYSSWVPFEIGYGYDKTVLWILCLKGIAKGTLPEYLRIAPVIRDIWDLNNFIGKTNKNFSKEFIKKSLLEFNNTNNPLRNIMDDIIVDR